MSDTDTLSLHDALPIFMDAEGYRVAPFTYALVIGYNTRALSREQRPKSYEELLEPKWKGQVGLEAAGYEWLGAMIDTDRKSTRLNSSHLGISYAVFCLK